jgi:hypothetical protein
MVRILVQNSFDYNKDYIEAAGLRAVRWSWGRRTYEPDAE